MRPALALLPMVLVALLVPVAQAATVQYIVLASFDFLSVDEVGSFENITLAGDVWNTTLTSYSVSGGKLNISNTDTVDALLVFPRTLNGYVEVTLDSGVIGVFTNYNGTGSVLTGYEIVKDSNGITVYEVNGTSKTAVASLVTTASTIIVTVMDGKFRVDLPDGTGIYEAPMDGAVLALGAPASDGTTATYGVFDKIVLYGRLLAGSYEIDLGTKTITPSSRVVAFSYDVSSYTNIRSARLVVTMSTTDDLYSRYYIITTKDPGQDFWRSWPAEYIDKGTIGYEGTIDVDVTTIVKNSPKGTFYVGISTFVGSWKVSAKLVLDADASGGSSSPSTTTASSGGTVEVLSGDTTKYALLGVGAVLLLAVIFMMAGRGGRGRGMAMILALFLFLLILGGIAILVLAFVRPEYLTLLAFGLGGIAIITLLLLMFGAKSLPNPLRK